MNTEDETILDDLFLGCALTAFLQVAMEQGAMPDSEKTRRRAYELYEESLRDKCTATLSRRLEL
jgi:hypothetical protein